MSTSLVDGSRQSDTARAGKVPLRADIQGLRALAVVAVVFDHLVHWPSGGFAGVDVFFVISGYLITSLLLREYQQSGTISLAGFYRRRTRRLLPVAVLVLLATTATSYLFFNVGRANTVFTDSLWSLGFLANWRFAITGTDYFTAGLPVSPLQHLWSLSVEEQFYLVWPWLILAVFTFSTLSRRLEPAARFKVLGVVMATIVLASFAWSVWETIANPTWSYFSTFSRAWELGAGALVAVYATKPTAMPALFRSLVGWLGMALIVGSMLFINDSLPFPGPWAVVPVLGSGLVLLAGTGRIQPALWPLTNPVSRYLGNVSYSLYLWHFPVVILLPSVLAEGTRKYIVVAAVVILALAIGSYHLVEKPILASSWLRNPSSGMPTAKIPGSRPPRRLGRRGLVTLIVVAVASTGVGFATQVPKPSSSPALPVRVISGQDELTHALSAALDSEDWPRLHPAVDGDYRKLRAPQWAEDDCLNISRENLDRCNYGAVEASKTAVVLGDSIAISLLPGLIPALEPLEYSIRPLTLESCPFGLAPVRFSDVKTAPVYNECVAHHEWVAETVAELQPELVIISDAYQPVTRLMSGAEAAAAGREWAEGFSAALKQLPASSRIVVMMSPPGAINMPVCYTPISRPQNCTAGINPSWELVRSAEMTAAEKRGAVFVDTRQWFCVDGTCPSFVGTTPIYADDAHLTARYSEMLGAIMLAKLVEVEAVDPAS